MNGFLMLRASHDAALKHERRIAQVRVNHAHVQLFEAEQAYNRLLATIERVKELAESWSTLCDGCGYSKALCRMCKGGGKAACCPECKHTGHEEYHALMDALKQPIRDDNTNGERA